MIAPVDVPATRSNSSPAGRPQRRSISASTRAGISPRMPPPSMARILTSAGELGDAARVLLGALDELVRRLVLRDEAGLHAEVDGLRVVGDDRDRRLLGLDRVAAREREADALGAQQAEHLGVLGLVRARGVAPGPAPALVAGDAELRPHAGVQPLGHAL